MFILGSWCYTTDPHIVEDACNVRDCDKPDECTIIIYDYIVIRKFTTFYSIIRTIKGVSTISLTSVYYKYVLLINFVLFLKFSERVVYILPKWKERGFHGGLRFAIKEWNPDFLEGLDILILSHNKLDNLRLLIGADHNEKVKLIKEDEIVYQKTLPHVISAGKSF